PSSCALDFILGMIQRTQAVLRVCIASIQARRPAPASDASSKGPVRFRYSLEGSVTDKVALGSILTHARAVSELASGFYTALPPDAHPAQYDRRPAVYDAVVARSIYHRIVWGTSPRSYTRFAELALEAAGHGCFAEIGCGSLLFTAPMYRHTDTAF